MSYIFIMKEEWSGDPSYFISKTKNIKYAITDFANNETIDNKYEHLEMYEISDKPAMEQKSILAVAKPIYETRLKKQQEAFAKQRAESEEKAEREWYEKLKQKYG